MTATRGDSWPSLLAPSRCHRGARGRPCPTRGRRRRAAGEDSPWPDTEALRPNVRAVTREVADRRGQVELMEESADRYEDWEPCLRGSRSASTATPIASSATATTNATAPRAGYLPALAVDSRQPAPPRGLHVPRLPRKQRLRDRRPAARRHRRPRFGATAPAARAPRPRGRGALRAGRTERSSARCAHEAARTRLERSPSASTSGSPASPGSRSPSSATPTASSATCSAQGAARGLPDGAHLDRSDWDDPDYMFLALVGGDRPGRTCQDEPGEAVD